MKVRHYLAAVLVAGVVLASCTITNAAGAKILPAVPEATCSAASFASSCGSGTSDECHVLLSALQGAAQTPYLLIVSFLVIGLAILLLDQRPKLHNTALMQRVFRFIPPLLGILFADGLPALRN